MKSEGRDNVNRQTLLLDGIQTKVEQRLARWERTGFGRALWEKNYRLWSAQPAPEITDRLGWLTLPQTMQAHTAELMAFAVEIRGEGFRHVVLLGMGGSSLAPEVFQQTLGNASGYPELLVLDSTHPAAVRALDAKVNLARTLFVVSSKSGTTQETLSFYRHFWKRVGEKNTTAGRPFVAITDAGTPLETLARERGFRRCFLATPDVGGRYSALTFFGLVPAALIGADVPRLLNRAQAMAGACAASAHVTENPGLMLGAALGELALAGYDKATFLASPSLAAFPAWAERSEERRVGKECRL